MALACSHRSMGGGRGVQLRSVVTKRELGHGLVSYRRSRRRTAGGYVRLVAERIRECEGGLGSARAATDADTPTRAGMYALDTPWAPAASHAAAVYSCEGYPPDPGPPRILEPFGARRAREVE